MGLTQSPAGGGTTLTDSASLRAALSDENGTGAALFSGATSPSFVTPILGAASATSVTLGSGAFTQTAGTITSNSPAITITQTWNEGSTNFVPFTMTITDTASTGVGSGFLRYLIGAAGKFAISKSGIVTAATGYAIGTAVGVPSGAGGTYLTDQRLYNTAAGSDLYIGSSGLTNVVILDGSINKVNTPFIHKGYTVATLPAGTVGMHAYVTDALAPAFLATVVGGGAIVSPVFFNGSSWVAH